VSSVPRLLFSQGLGRALANFYVSSREGAREGLAALAGEQEVLRAARELGDALLAPVNSDVLVDYSPGDARYAELMAAVYPDATYVHVLRRPEDCLDADRRHPRRLAQAWVAGHQAVLRIPTGVRVVRVDVEALAAHPSAAVEPILTALGRNSETSQVARTLTHALAHEHTSGSRRARRTVARVAGPLWHELSGGR
jgi:hypothetical protein